MPDANYYLKLYIGEAVIAAALARAENDALRQRVAQLEAPKPEPPKE